MSQTIHLVNNYPGIIDLHMIDDVHGKPVMLRPKGHAGDIRECFPHVLEHPHVDAFIKAGRVRLSQPDEMPVLLAPPEPAVLKEFEPSIAEVVPEPPIADIPVEVQPVPPIAPVLPEPLETAPETVIAQDRTTITIEPRRRRGR